MMDFKLTPVKGREFVNRSDEIDFIINSCTRGKIGIALYGARRMGKTSILMETCRKLDLHPETTPVYISAWKKKTTVDKWAKELGFEIIKAYESQLDLKDSLKKGITDILAHLKYLKVGTKLYEDIEFFICSTKPEPDGLKTLEKALMLGDELAIKYKTQTILCIDEFPSLMELTEGKQIGDAIIAFIRTVYEQLDRTTLIVSGSIKKYLNITVFDSVAPFYKQLQPMKIDHMNKKHIKQLITKRISKNRFEGDSLEILAKKICGTPYYAHALGNQLQYKEKITEDDVEHAIQQYLQTTGHILYTDEMEKLSDLEREILICLAYKNAQTTAISTLIKKPTNYTMTYIGYLQDKALIKRVERGKYDISDQIFEQWMRSKYDKVGNTLFVWIEDKIDLKESTK